MKFAYVSCARLDVHFFRFEILILNRFLPLFIVEYTDFDYKDRGAPATIQISTTGR